ncbi:MAG: siphovirus Gp157 family protein [Bryobacteraceae bacterium]
MRTDLLIAEHPRTLSLYDLEYTLCAFAAMADDVDNPEQKAELLEELGSVLRHAKDKRDRVAAFLRHCKSQEAFADEEIERLRNRRDRISRVRSELEAYVVQVIEQLVEPDRRGVQRLDGNHSSLRIQRNPESVAITEVDALPGSLKDAAITLPAFVWQALLESVAPEARATYEALVKKFELKPDKRAIAAELKSGSFVSGAHLKAGDFRLVIS